MVNKLKGLVIEEQGQGMTEYGLVLGIIAVAVVGVLAFLREEILEMFNGVKDAVSNRDSTPTT
ncbi:Flp family type IVb pilin [Calidifontibacillus oryziterrae]|uniref:Flp family type IVb pilin n=1 Tax=Calidifontibacillus oryziterrae TaxID=1191699 RepID=UPI0002F8FBB1|nr:Flp family type IVb pilin [Calidifontibacillus oryziterrae]